MLEVGIAFADTSAANEIRDCRLACCRAVFLNRQAAARYRALASIIPCRD